jgi:hypothetical protein
MLSQFKTLRAAPLSPQDLFKKYPGMKTETEE